MKNINFKTLTVLILGITFLVSPISAMESKNDLSIKKNMNMEENTSQKASCKDKEACHKNKYLKFKSIIKPSEIGVELSKQNYGGEQIDYFHLDSGPTLGLNGAWQIKQSPFYIQSSFIYGKHYAKGAKDIEGTHSSTQEPVFATIQKEKSYESFQGRVGIEYRHSFHDKFNYFSYVGLVSASNHFNFRLKSISDNQNPNHFNFPNNYTQNGLGAYIGLGASYAFAKDYSVKVALDYSEVKNNQDENLLGSKISLMISKRI